MSTDRSASSEQKSGTQNGDLEAPALDLPSGHSRELPSNSIPDLLATKATLASGEKHLPDSEFRPSLPPRKFSISTARSPTGLRSQSHERSSVNSRDSSPSVPSDDDHSAIRRLIVRSFAPRVAIHASSDTQELLKDKGFGDGLEDLFRPYGERLQGKVIIRDSFGGSKAYDDFGVRFVSFQQLRLSSTDQVAGDSLASESKFLPIDSQILPRDKTSFQDDSIGEAIDQVLDRHLQDWLNIPTDLQTAKLSNDPLSHTPQSDSLILYRLYLRKVLSSIPIVPYETFSHPVACLIAVSSHHPAPIEALRQLYADTNQREERTPAWIGRDYLRYYVLIHDEEKDDIVKSTALFDLMKRHFGLHCHLLRVRSSECVETDDDSVRVPSCDWLSAKQELDQGRGRDLTTDDIDNSERYIFESDAAAVRALLREMVTQSIVPFMENRIMTWNDQVASRRRGISGRFMSLSKRWTGFGSSKSPISGSAANAGSSSSNYDHQLGFYLPDTPEATMRQLGDYAFMLRDWKLAHSTYDLLRADFSHDKAWSYHAAANEMAAITTLLISQSYNSRSRSETIDQMLDTAAYSYLTRCSMPINVVRCLTLALELFKNKGHVFTDDAARWGGRLLELGVLSPIAQILNTERMADCYASQVNSGPLEHHGRKRQAALWSILASKSWLSLDRSAQARSRLMAAKALYGLDDQTNVRSSFPDLQPLWLHLDRALYDEGYARSSTLIDLENISVTGEESAFDGVEQLNVLAQPTYTDDVDTEGFTNQNAGSSVPSVFDENR